MAPAVCVASALKQSVEIEVRIICDFLRLIAVESKFELTLDVLRLGHSFRLFLANLNLRGHSMPPFIGADAYFLNGS
jgi:hypothetical protein